MIVYQAGAYLNQWLSVQIAGESNSSTGLVPDDSKRWRKPTVNGVKINCDAAIFVEETKFGVGWLARDSNGSLLAAAALSFNGAVDAHFAEAVGVRETLSWIK